MQSPEPFQRGMIGVGIEHRALIGGVAYCSNHDPHAILLALQNTHGLPSPAEHNANDAAFAAPWNMTDPIKLFLTGWKIVT